MCRGRLIWWWTYYCLQYKKFYYFEIFVLHFEKNLLNFSQNDRCSSFLKQKFQKRVQIFYNFNFWGVSAVRMTKLLERTYSFFL